MARLFQTFVPDAERQLWDRFGELLPACGDCGELANLSICVAQGTQERRTALRTEGNEGGQAEGKDAYAAIAMIQEFAQFLQRNRSRPGHLDFARRAREGHSAGAQRLSNRPFSQRRGVAAQVFGQHDPG